MAGFRGHLRGGAVAAALMTGMMVWHNSAVSVEMLPSVGVLTGAAMFGSLLPDIDHPKSFLGSRMKIVSKPAYKLFGHRTITHSLFFIGALTYWLYRSEMPFAALGLCSGMLSHIILDLLCLNSGVAFLYPIYPRRIYLNIGVYIMRGCKKYLRKSKKRKRK